MTPEGDEDRGRRVTADSVPRSREEPTQPQETREESSPREEDLTVRKKRKTSDPEPASQPFTELLGMEKARRFDLAVKRLLTKADIEVCRNLNEE